MKGLMIEQAQSLREISFNTGFIQTMSQDVDRLKTNQVQSNVYLKAIAEKGTTGGFSL
jgi:hypothetical protein